jgi:hypothetical protein
VNKNLLGAVVGLGMTGYFALECLNRLNAMNAQKVISLGRRGRTGIPNSTDVIFSGGSALIGIGIVMYAIYLYTKERQK